MEKNHWRKIVSVKWNRSRYSEVSPSDIAIKGMLKKVCYFTWMKCIMFFNQIVFMLFCFVLLLWPVCCTGKKHPPPPFPSCAATINTLFFWGFFSFSFFFLAEVIKACSYQCRRTDETSRMWDTCKVSTRKRCQHLRKNEKEKRPYKLILIYQFHPKA